MKPLPPVTALIVALAGACSTGTLDPPPPPPVEPATVTFELQNNSSPTVYLFQDCLLEYAITSLAGSPQVIERPGPCACDCAQSSCPVCGACLLGSYELLGGTVVNQYWSTVSVTHEPAPAGSCERRHTLPPGPYRIDVPVYPTAEDAVARTGGRIATQSFVLPAPGNSVIVPLGLTR